MPSLATRWPPSAQPRRTGVFDKETDLPPSNAWPVHAGATRDGINRVIRCDREGVVRIRCGFEFPLLLAAYSKFSAQPNDAIPAGGKSLRCQRRLQTQWSVAFPDLDVGSSDGNLQSFIVLCALR